MSTQDELKELTESAESAHNFYGDNLKVECEIVDESELDESEFAFDLQDIQETLKVPIRVWTFQNPKDPDKPFKFAMRQLTAEENAKIYANSFSPELLKGALKMNGKRRAAVIDEDAILDDFIKGLSSTDDFQAKTLSQNIAAVFTCMVYPKKKTLKSVGSLPQGIIHNLAEGCREEVNRVWTFQ